MLQRQYPNKAEHASHLSRQYMEEHAEIPWRKIAGVRNRLVHDYDGINWEIIADVIFEDLPQLIESLKPLCGDGEDWLPALGCGKGER